MDTAEGTPLKHEQEFAGAKNLKEKGSLIELDVYRGIAAVLMIVNHSGNELISRTGGSPHPASFLVFLGSFAPALFFLATGFGVALSSKARKEDGQLAHTLWKALILVLADQLFWWNDGTILRLDFFSFIAISTILLTVLSRHKNSVYIASLLLVTTVVVRYGLAPYLSSAIAANEFINWIAGTPGIRNISYPFSPWMVYPLLGFIAGNLYLNLNNDIQIKYNYVYLVTIIFAMSSIVISVFLYYEGKVFFRWGSVSVAYFILSLGMVAIAWQAAKIVSKNSAAVSRALSLRGASSFLVIPLHYALIHFIKMYAYPIKNPIQFIIAATLIISLAFAAAKITENILRSIYDLPVGTIFGWASILVAISSYLPSLFLEHGGQTDLGTSILLFSQIAIGGLFLWKPRSRTHMAN